MKKIKAYIDTVHQYGPDDYKPTIRVIDIDATITVSELIELFFDKSGLCGPIHIIDGDSK